MPDLGLNALTDDQLLNLLQEACGELAARDPFVRGLAQQQIFTEAEKVKALKEGAAKAVEALKREYCKSISADIANAVRSSHKAGKLQLLNAEQEANVVVDAEIHTRIALIDEAVAKLKAGTSERFALEITPAYIAFCDGGQNFQMPRKMAPDTVTALGRGLRAILEQ